MYPGKLTKKFYKIGDVAEILEIPASTLRFWEKKFTIIKPRRNAGGTRFYTPDDIEKISMIHYLVKEKKLRLEAAEEAIRNNPDGIDKRHAVVARLRTIRAEVKELLDTLRQIK